MRNNQAALTAVLTTVLRATADATLPVVLRTGRIDQARDLAGWLERMHGSRRRVIASRHARGPIQLSLPSQVDWPERLDAGLPAGGPLATVRPPLHFTRMLSAPPPSDRR